MDDAISVREAIRISGYTRQHIYNLIVQLQVAAQKAGREYRVSRSSLLKYRNQTRRARRAKAK